MFQEDLDTQKDKHKVAFLEIINSRKSEIKKTKLIVKYLKKHPEQILVRFNDESTLLHMAVQQNMPALVNYLVTAAPELMAFNDLNRFSPVRLAVEMSNHEIITLFRQVIFRPNNPQNTEERMEALSQQFSELKLFKYKTDSGKKVSPSFLVAADEDLSADVFSKAIDLMKMSDHYIENSEADFERLLLLAGFEYRSDSHIDWNDNPVWNLCAFITLEGNNVVKRKSFDKNYFSQVLQGILSFKSVLQILNDINDSWKRFDKSQKLIAVYLIKELTIRDPNQTLLRPDADISSKLRRITKKIIQDFPFHGKMMVKLIQDMKNAQVKLINNPIYLEYRTLCENTQNPNEVKHKPSFEKLLLDTISLKDRESSHNILLIAAEISAISLRFYHNVHISEYYDTAWVKHNSEERASNIRLQIDTLNDLSAYIQSFILRSKTPEEAIKRISLFIRVAMQLTQGVNGIGPDLNALTLVMISISSFAVSRLNPYFEMLSNDERRQYSQLKELVSPLSGFKSIRNFANASEFAILSSSLIQAEVSFAYENTAAYQKLESLGVVLNNVLNFQRRVRRVPFNFETNLLYKLKSKKYVMKENHFYCLSGRFRPVIIDVLSLDDLMEILKYMIKNKFLPNIQYRNEVYGPENLLIPILRRLKESIFDIEFERDDIKQITIKARKLGIDLIQLLNSEFNLELGIEPISLYLPEPSPITSRQARNSLEYEQSRPLMMSKSSVNVKRRTIEAPESPSRQRKKRLSQS